MNQSPEHFKKKKIVEKINPKYDVEKTDPIGEGFREEFDSIASKYNPKVTDKKDKEKKGYDSTKYDMDKDSDNIGYEPTEEEEFIFQNDPELQISDNELIENTADNEGVDGFIGEGLSTEFLESLDKRSRVKFRDEVKDISNIDRRVDFIHEVAHRDFDETPFEDRDILSEILHEARTEKDTAQNEILKNKMKDQVIERRDLIKRKNNLESAPAYGKDEFKLIKKASFAYEANRALDRARNEMSKLDYPTFSDGHLLKVEQITEQAEKYAAYKNNPDKGKYADIQLDLMKGCYNFIEAHNKLIQAEEYVQKLAVKGFYKDETDTFVKGILPETEINNLARQYFELRDNNFPEFVKCQVNAGIWKLKDFNWKQGEHKGVTQWSSTHKENGEKPGEKITCKYITFDQPLPIENLKGFAYTERFIKQSKDHPDFRAIIIDLKKPHPVKKQKLVEA